jgi:hypothetical protein
MATRKTKQPQKKLRRSPPLVLKSSWLSSYRETKLRLLRTCQCQTPNLGERVSIDSHGTIFSITRVSENNVDLQLPGTNIERFRVPVDDLRYVDVPREASPLSTPAKPAINLEEVESALPAHNKAASTNSAATSQSSKVFEEQRHRSGSAR